MPENPPKQPNDKKTLITFPCEFPLKIIGVADSELENNVSAIIRKHIPAWDGRIIQARKSENGKYLALSVTIPTESQNQLDDLYRELSSSPQISMVL